MEVAKSIQGTNFIEYLTFLVLFNLQTFVGTDIADLLLDGHEPTTVDYSMMGLKINPSSDTLDEDFDETVNMSVTTSDRSVISRGRKSHEEATDRFRHLLLYGRKKVKLLDHQEM